MSEKAGTFVDLCLSGQALATDVDRYVEEWHRTTGAGELYEYLGLTKAEYALWVRDPATLKAILHARKEGIPVTHLAHRAKGCRVATRARPGQDAEKPIERFKQKRHIPN